jgi:wyosine [tRNA(Phe)-imidazoG37] synthetase (radical SAM superfamily)
MQVNRRKFYKPEEIFHEAELKIKQLNSKNEYADYFSFVPDGEPTLDINLGTEIDLLKCFDIKIAVITNASLIWMDDVKENLMKADWVSVSIDAADEDTWRKIDRPHGSLRHQDILNGIVEFSKAYKGTLVTETMLVDGINDHEACIKKVAEQLATILPKKAYLLVPTRPPAENSIKRSSKDSLINAAEIVRSISGVHVECLTGDEKEEGFFFSEDIVNDILSITSVHPIRKEIVDEMLKKRNVDKAVIDDLVKRDMIVEFLFEGKKFYKKNLKNKF